MKNTKKLLALTLIFALMSLLVLTSCTGGVSMDESENMVKSFCNALKNDDYETASTLMHKNAGLDAQKIEESIANIENTCGFDFSDGVEFVQRTNYSVMNNINIPAGFSTTITIQYDISVSEKDCALKVVLLNNSAGLGIYSFYINLPSGVGSNAA